MIVAALTATAISLDAATICWPLPWIAVSCGRVHRVGAAEVAGSVAHGSGGCVARRAVADWRGGTRRSGETAARRGAETTARSATGVAGEASVASTVLGERGNSQDRNDNGNRGETRHGRILRPFQSFDAFPAERTLNSRYDGATFIEPS